MDIETFEDMLPNNLGVGHSVHDPVERFRKFYADTAVYGTVSALMWEYDFFGADHLFLERLRLWDRITDLLREEYVV